MSDEPISQIIMIEDGAEAKAKPLRQNFTFLNNQISTLQSSLANKESLSSKNAANGYCGLDSSGKLPESVRDDVINVVATALFPVGSLYSTVSDSQTCPIALLIPNSTWVKVASGRVLQGADSNHEPDTTIAAGLPNIKGNFNGNSLYDIHNSVVPYAEGAFETGGSVKKGTPSTGADSKQFGYNFDASRSSSIYSDDVTTVQPPAYVIVVWKRTA